MIKSGVIIYTPGNSNIFQIVFLNRFWFFQIKLIIKYSLQSFVVFFSFVVGIKSFESFELLLIKIQKKLHRSLIFRT